MRKKKQDGSALVLVLLFTLFFTVISGVTVVAVVGSFRANTAEEKYESLYYEADAGIEKAIALANCGEYSNPAFVEADHLTEPSKYEIDMNEAIVRFSVKKVVDPVAGNYLRLESTATDKTNSSITRTVKAKMGLTPVAGGSDLFRYSLCGTKVELQSTGVIDMGTSIINSSPSDAIFSSLGIPPAEENVAFAVPDFDETKIPHQTEVTLNITGTLKNTLFVNSTNITDSINSTIERIDYRTSTTPALSSRVPFTIYLVNADVLKIKAPLVGFNDMNMMIICSGDVLFDTTNPNPLLPPNTGMLSGSGIIGKNVGVERGVLNISYPPYNDLYPNRGGNSPLALSDLSAITAIVAEYAPNFAGGAGGGGGGAPGGTLLPTDYE